MANIIHLEFDAFSGRVKAFGPDVVLDPKAAQTFALLAHELATNAIKYGALSQPGGRIEINCRLATRTVKRDLSFSGGNAVGRPWSLRPVRASAIV